MLLPACIKGSPVLIYGPRKAGTTLAQNLHDGSSQIFVYPWELKLKFLTARFFPPDLVSMLELYKQSSRTYPIKFVNYEGYQKTLTEPPVIKVSGLRDLILNDIISTYQSVEPSVRPDSSGTWLAKEVGGSPHGILRAWRHLFSDGRVIMMLRHPLMVVRSVILDRRRKNVRLGFRSIYREVAECFRVLNAQVEYVGESGVMFITYERLTEDPEREMRRSCKFLDIDYHHVFSHPTVFGEPTVVRTSSKARRDVFRNQNGWHKDLTPRELFCVLLSFLIVWIRNSGWRRQGVFQAGGYREMTKGLYPTEQDANDHRNSAAHS